MCLCVCVPNTECLDSTIRENEKTTEGLFPHSERERQREKLRERSDEREREAG